MSIIFHPEVESKIKLRVVRSLGDKSFETEDNSTSSKNSDEINESLLEDGVSLRHRKLIQKKRHHRNFQKMNQLSREMVSKAPLLNVTQK